MARIRLNGLEVTATAQRRALPLVQLTSRQVLASSRRLAPRGDHLSGSGRPKHGPALVPSLDARIDVGVTRILGTIGSRNRYAATVHQGSKAHIIRAKGKLLKFRSDRLDFLVAARSGRRGGNKRTGGFHYRISVRHPGNKRPVRYLTTPLVLFGRANGFRVSTIGGARTRLP